MAWVFGVTSNFVRDRQPDLQGMDTVCSEDPSAQPEARCAQCCTCLSLFWVKWEVFTSQEGACVCVCVCSENTTFGTQYSARPVATGLCPTPAQFSCIFFFNR